MTRLRKWLKEIIVLVVIIFISTTAMDWWRKPAHLAPQLLAPMTLANGESVSLAQLSRDKPILVYFWATWCGVCKMTSPMVAELAAAGVPVISVAIRSGDSQLLLQGMHKKGLNFPVINDIDGQISALAAVSATPSFMIIDHGEMVSFTSGWTSYWGLKARLLLAAL